MRVRKILKYNVWNFPEDVIRIVGTHNFFALSLAFIYYGGGAVIIYDTLRLPSLWPIAIWMLSAIINIALINEFPGLFYLDKVRSTDFKLSVIILGPINFLRALCLGIAFVHKLKSPYPFTIRHFLKTSPEIWSLDDPWIKAIQRSRDIGTTTLVGGIRWVLSTIGRWLWKIGNIKITAYMVLRALLSLVVVSLFAMAIFTAWLKITGKM